MPPRSDPAPAPDRASKILAAADQLFGDRGYDAVSVRDVATLAEVNKALIFYYFKSKEELFARVIEPYYAAHHDALEAAFATKGSLRDRLHATIDAYVGFIDRHRRYAHLVQGQLAGSGPQVELIARNMEPLFRWTVDALSEIAPTSGPRAARHLYLTVSAAVINYYTYAGALAPVWGTDPLSDEAVGERTAHLHWLVDTILDALEREQPTG